MLTKLWKRADENMTTNLKFITLLYGSEYKYLIIILLLPYSKLEVNILANISVGQEITIFLSI